MSLFRLLRPTLMVGLIFGLFLLVLSGVPAEAGAGRWVQVRTDEFIFIFKETDRAAAQEAIDLGPGVFRKVSEYLDYSPSERVPVVIFGDTAYANGYFSPYPPHISLFVSSPSGPWLGASTESWLEVLFVHELIHYVHLTRPIGLFGVPSRVFGPLLSAASMLFAPGWFIEGPTTYGESLLAPGGRGDNPFFEIEHIAPVLEGRMYSYDQAGFGSQFAPPGRIYAAGYLMVEHLLREYGEDSFVELNRRFQRIPLLGMRRAIRKTTGVKAEQFYTAMVLALEDAYAERRELPRGALLSPPGPGDWALPVLTERGLVSYGRSFNRSSGLYLLPMAALEEQQNDVLLSRSDRRYRDKDSDHWELLSPVQLFDEHSWSVDASGSTAVVAVHQVPLSLEFSAPGASDLFLLDLSGGAPPRRVSTGARLFHPALSADGEQLVAVERVGSYAQLVEIDPAGGERRPVYQPAAATLYNPVFSPDGRLIALTENRSGRQWVTILDSESGKPLEYLQDSSGAALYFPRFVQTGQDLELWAGGDRGGRLALYRSRLEPGGGAQVSAGPLELLIEDQVAAYAGFRHAEQVIYGGYTSDGYVVQTAPLPQVLPAGTGPGLELLPTAAAPPGTPPGTRPAPGAPIQGETTYRDRPRPILWLPLIEFRTGSNEDTELEFGAFLIAASNLGRHDINLYLGYNPWSESPSASLGYTLSPGPTTWHLLADITYEDESGRQSTSIGLSAERMLWLQSHPGYIRGLGARTGLEYSWMESAGAELSTNSMLRLFRQERTALRDFYGPRARQLSVELSYVPELLDTEEFSVETRSQAFFAIQPLHSFAGLPGALQITPTAVLSTSTAGDALGGLPYRGGGFDDRRTLGSAAVPASADLAWLGRLSMRVPLGIYDAAWRGLGSTGTGVMLYLEQGGAVQGYGLRPTASAVVGTELTLQLFFNMIPFRVTGGAAWRLPHPGSATGSGWLLYLGAEL